MTTNIDIRLASNRVSNTIPYAENAMPRLFTPGEVITSQQGFMRYVFVQSMCHSISFVISFFTLFKSGHGTYIKNDEIRASVAGVMEKVNKLISIRPLKSRYVGEIGDVVVARVTEVQQKRWKVNTNSRLDSILFLAAVNLPGGGNDLK